MRLPLYHGLAMRILKSSADADEAVQTAMLRGWSRCFLLRTPDKLVGWLGRIVINESYNILRRRKREATVPLETLPELPACEAEASQAEDEEERLQRLEKAIAALPDLYRQTVHIGLLSRLKSEEAAALLGCSVNTLYQRIHKAKKMLRETLRNE